MNLNLKRLIVGGAAGTAVMTMLMYFAAPMMLGRPMDIAAMLGQVLAGSWALGMLMHLVNGTVIFPLILGSVVYHYLPGAAWFRGATWGAILWLVSQAVVMPMMGAGFFSSQAGGLMAAGASLMGHLVYGMILGGSAGKDTGCCAPTASADAAS